MEIPSPGPIPLTSLPILDLPHRRYTLPPSFSTPGLAAASLDQVFYRANSHSRKRSHSTNAAMSQLVKQATHHKRPYPNQPNETSSNDSERTRRRAREAYDLASREVSFSTPSVFSFTPEPSSDQRVLGERYTTVSMALIQGVSTWISENLKRVVQLTSDAFSFAHRALTLHRPLTHQCHNG